MCTSSPTFFFSSSGNAVKCTLDLLNKAFTLLYLLFFFFLVLVCLSCILVIYSDLSSHSQFFCFTVSDIYFISIWWGLCVCVGGLFLLFCFFVCFWLAMPFKKVLFSAYVFSMVFYFSENSVFCMIIVISHIFAGQPLLSLVAAGSCL